MRLAWVLSILSVRACAFGDECFPAGSLGETSSQHQFKAGWYSSQLAALREPSLWQLSREMPSKDSYRFLYLRSFHHPICVRLTLTTGGIGLLTSKETDGKGGYGRYHVVDRWSPSADDPIHVIGTMLMINLAHFRLLYQDVY